MSQRDRTFTDYREDYWDERFASLPGMFIKWISAHLPSSHALNHTSVAFSMDEIKLFSADPSLPPKNVIRDQIIKEIAEFGWRSDVYELYREHLKPAEQEIEDFFCNTFLEAVFPKASYNRDLERITIEQACQRLRSFATKHSDVPLSEAQMDGYVHDLSQFLAVNWDNHDFGMCAFVDEQPEGPNMGVVVYDKTDLSHHIFLYQVRVTDPPSTTQSSAASTPRNFLDYFRAFGDGSINDYATYFLRWGEIRGFSRTCFSQTVHVFSDGALFSPRALWVFDSEAEQETREAAIRDYLANQPPPQKGLLGPKPDPLRQRIWEGEAIEFFLQQIVTPSIRANAQHDPSKFKHLIHPKASSVAEICSAFEEQMGESYFKQGHIGRKEFVENVRAFLTHLPESSHCTYYLTHKITSAWMDIGFVAYSRTASSDRILFYLFVDDN